MEMTSLALVSVTEVVWEGSGADNKISEKNNTTGNHGNRYFDIQHNVPHFYALGHVVYLFISDCYFLILVLDVYKVVHSGLGNL